MCIWTDTVCRFLLYLLNDLCPCSSPDGNTVSAAEHACGLMLAVARNVAAADRSMKAGQWDRKKFTGSELNGKILGVLGVGRIGRAVAVRMQAFGMKTIGFDPLVPPAVMKENNIEPIELEELWRVSDYITVHTPLLPSTKGWYLITNEMSVRFQIWQINRVETLL